MEQSPRRRTRVKGTPRRRAVQALHPAYSPRRRQATANYPPPGRRTGYAFAKGSATPTGERKLWHNLCHQPLRFAPLTTSLYTREAFGWYASNSPYTGEASPNGDAGSHPRRALSPRGFGGGLGARRQQSPRTECPGAAVRWGGVTLWDAPVHRNRARKSSRLR